MNGEVVLRNGRTIMIFGIAAPNPLGRPDDQTAQHLLETLNKEAANRIRSVPASGGLSPTGCSESNGL